MNKINNIIKKNLNLWISVFILLHPIIDFITGVFIQGFNFNLTLGIIIRIIFLFFIMYSTIFVYKKKQTLIYYFIFLIYSFLYLIGILVFKEGIGLFTELQGLIRTFYFPLLILSLYQLKDEIKISKMLLVFTLGIYLICIFIPMIFNVGYQSYQITKKGTLGFYNSANEISGIISILTPILFIVFKELKRNILKILFILIYLVVIFTVGTKTPLLSLLITLGMMFFWIIGWCIKKKKYKSVIYSTSIIMIGIIAMIMVIPKTNFYKNIITHLEYLKVDSIVEVMKDEELLDHFIFSQRLTFWKNRDITYNKADLYQKAIGLGYLENGKISKLIEMDYIDVYYSHGFIGCFIFFLPYIYVLTKIFKTKQKLTFEHYMSLISFSLVVFLSLFTGHIITAPAVSLISIIIILNLDKKPKKQLLFTLDEKCDQDKIIKILNNINYNNYEVTLVKEKNIDILLSKINQNIYIQEIIVSNNSNMFIRKIINFISELWFFILNYHNYDFSCCYASYSLRSNKLSRISSSNNAIYIDSDCSNKKEIKKLFDVCTINEFEILIFDSKQVKEKFKTIYPKLDNKQIILKDFNKLEKIVI